MHPDSSSRITNINAEAWRRAKKRPWALVLIASVSTTWIYFVYRMEWPHGDVGETLMAMFLPLIFLAAVYYSSIIARVQSDFWREFAARNGFSYAKTYDITSESGLMFKQGGSRSAEHVVRGTFRNVPIKVFSYYFSITKGESSIHYFYTVFEFMFSGTFPHLYLNRLDNGYGLETGEIISLPYEFEKHFRLYAPKEYEIEALQVFTPDILAALLEDDFRHDIEIVDGELLIFRKHHINSTEELEEEFKAAIRIYEYFASVLNRIRFAEIGDYSPYLGGGRMTFL